MTPRERVRRAGTRGAVGPSWRPAGARRQVVGVGDPAAAPKLAEVLHLLGTEHALVVHGKRVDELPLDGTGVILDVTPDAIVRRPVDAIALAALGIAPASTGALAGGSPAENAVLIEAVLAGERGPRRDVAILNAAAGLIAAGRATDLAAGVELASATIEGGRAPDLLARLRRSRRLREAAASPGGEATPGRVDHTQPATGAAR